MSSGGWTGLLAVAPGGVLVVAGAGCGAVVTDGGGPTGVGAVIVCR
jgi:hypothetical protein